ncbi:MAG: LPS assembly protein LptD [Acidobacteriota bacterium]
MTRSTLSDIRALTRVSLLAAVLLTGAATPLFAQGKDMGPAGQYYQQNKKFKIVPAAPTKGGEVTWQVAKGGRQEIEKDEYALLENEVRIKYQDVSLAADKVTLNLKTKDAVAEGHVIIDQGPTRLTANHAVFNLDSKIGTMFDATGAMEPSLYFTGEKLEKTGDHSYVLTNGVFTSCDIDHPAWAFHVGTANITLDDYARMKDLTFRAHDFPIFWAPRLVFPTKRDRSRGFLIPRIRVSSAFGQRAELGYFLPLGDSADATFYGEINTKGYNGGGIDLRYLPNQNVKLGELNAYAVHDADTGRLQWRYALQHAQDNLPGGFRGVVDVQDFSDLDFFRKFDNDPRLHTLSNIYSSAYLTKNVSNYSLNILSDRRDIVLSPTLKQRFEQLPSLQFRAYPQRVGGTPLYFSIESSLSHLVTSGLTNGPTADYFRGDIFPTLSLQLRTPAWLSVKPQLSLRGTYYSQQLGPLQQTSQGVVQTAADKSLSRFYGQGQVEMIGPSFSRVYNEAFGGFSKFKHVIEPRLRYVYTTDVRNKDQVIRFDTVDSPSLPFVQDSVEYSLTQRIIGKESGPNGSSREVMSFSLRQTASLSKPFTAASNGSVGSTFVDAGQKFTPLVASLHVNPYQSITFDANTTFGNVSHQIDQTSLSANLVGTGKNSDKYLSFTWFASFRQPDVPASVDTSSSQIRLNSGSSLWRDRMRADVQLNFDVKKGTFLEQRYLIGGNGSCYGVAVEYRRYLVYAPTVKSINNYGISFTLKNVGTIGTH